MKHIYFIFLLLFVVLFFYTPVQAEAHVLKSSGSVGAVLHIDPEDDPVVGQQSGFFFDFKDTENKFSLANCECMFAVQQTGKTIYTQPLIEGEGEGINGIASYTFPERDIYVVEVRGKPKAAGAFEAFTLTYPIRVERESKVEPELADNMLTRLLPITFFVLLLVVLGVVMLLNKKRTEKGGDKT